MGLFDLPAPLFTLVDWLMAFVLPASLRLVVWACVTAVATLLLYKLLSPQAQIGQAKRAARDARKQLNGFDGEFADAGPLIRAQFATAFKHIGLVVPGTLIAVVPLVCFLVWADTHYAHALPSGQTSPPVQARPDGAGSARWLAGTPPAVVVQTGGREYRFALTAPVPVITPKPWWHWLVANPLGYLPAASPIERVAIGLPERHYLPFGPDWLRGWLGLFIPAMFIASLAIFKLARIE